VCVLLVCWFNNVFLNVTVLNHLPDRMPSFSTIVVMCVLFHPDGLIISFLFVLNHLPNFSNAIINCIKSVLCLIINYKLMITVDCIGLLCESVEMC